MSILLLFLSILFSCADYHQYGGGYDQYAGGHASYGGGYGYKEKRCDGYCEKKLGHGSYCQYWKDYPICYDPKSYEYGYGGGGYDNGRKYECSYDCRADCDSYCYYRTGKKVSCRKNDYGEYRCGKSKVRCGKRKCYSKYHRGLAATTKPTTAPPEK